MFYTCKQLQQKLKELKALKQEYDLELADAIINHQTEKIKHLKNRIADAITNLREQADKDHLALRRRIAKEHNFRLVKGFNNNFALALGNDNKWYYVNSEGKKIGQGYELVKDWENGRGVVKTTDNQWFFIDESGEISDNTGYKKIIAEKNGYWIVCLGQYRWQILDRFGKSIDGREYRVVKNITGKGAIVNKGHNLSSTYIDLQGNVIKDNCVNLDIFSDGWAKMGNGKYIDLNGHEAPYQYKRVRRFCEGRAIVKNADDLMYVVDQEFNKKGGFYKSIRDYSNGFTVAEKNADECVYLDKEGNESKQVFDFADDFTKYGLARVRKNKQYFFVNRQFDQVGGIYKQANKFTNGFAEIVKSDNKKYYINIKGEEIGEGYKLVSQFCNRRAWVEKDDGFWYLIDEQGNELTSPPGYDNVKSGIFDPSIVINRINGENQYYIVDKHGKELTEGYDRMELFSDGLVVIKKGIMVYYLDKYGNIFP